MVFRFPAGSRVTDGSIIANIITAHMTSMKAKSATDQVVIDGMDMPEPAISEEAAYPR